MTRPDVTRTDGTYRGDCRRCQRPDLIVRSFAGQDLCATCYRAAFKTVGTCHRCGVHRLVPARDGPHPICAPCAGLTGFGCVTCGDATSPMQHRTQCARCRIRTLLTDRTEPPATIDAFIDRVAGRHPKTIARWTAPGPELTAFLQHITNGDATIVRWPHDSTGPRSSPARDPSRMPIHDDSDPVNGEHHQLALFERWTQRFLASVTDPADRRTVMMFTSWHEQRKLVRSATIGTLRTWSTRTARQRITYAAVFLDWLREHNVTLAGCSQADLDTWFSTGTSSRQSTTGFIVWAQTQQLCDRRLRITPIKPATPNAISNQDRVELVRRLLHDTNIRLDDRVAGLLVALYAQPSSRVCQLRRDSVTINDNVTRISLGPRPIEVIAPFDELLRRLVKTSNNRWLFPGTIPGEPCHPNTTGQRLLRLGITRATRVAAFHDLVQQIPGPVLAELIGYNPNFVAERAATLAAPWSNYPTLRNRTQAPRK